MSEPLPGSAVRAFIDRAQSLADQAEHDWSSPPTHRVDECELRKHYRPLAEQETLSTELERLADAALVELSGGGWDGRDAEQRTQALLLACRSSLAWTPAQYRVEHVETAGMQALREEDKRHQTALLGKARTAALALRRASCAAMQRTVMAHLPNAGPGCTTAPFDRLEALLTEMLSETEAEHHAGTTDAWRALQQARWAKREQRRAAIWGLCGAARRAGAMVGIPAGELLNVLSAVEVHGSNLLDWLSGDPAAPYKDDAALRYASRQLPCSGALAALRRLGDIVRGHDAAWELKQTSAPATEQGPKAALEEPTTPTEDHDDGEGPEAFVIPPDKFRFGQQSVEGLSQLEWKLLAALCRDGRLLPGVARPDVIAHVYEIDTKDRTAIEDKARTFKERRRSAQRKLDAAEIRLEIDLTNDFLRLKAF